MAGRSPDALLVRFGLGDEDRDAWERSGLPLDSFEEWLTDRVARRPAGARARQVYGAEDAHVTNDGGGQLAVAVT